MLSKISSKGINIEGFLILGLSILLKIVKKNKNNHSFSTLSILKAHVVFPLFNLVKSFGLFEISRQCFV